MVEALESPNQFFAKPDILVGQPEQLVYVSPQKYGIAHTVLFKMVN